MPASSLVLTRRGRRARGLLLASAAVALVGGLTVGATTGPSADPGYLRPWFPSTPSLNSPADKPTLSFAGVHVSTPAAKTKTVTTTRPRPRVQSSPAQKQRSRSQHELSFRGTLVSFFEDYGLPLACGGELSYDQQGVANKELACGTVVTFSYQGNTVTVPVIDRGPYIGDREFDLTGATARSIGLTDETGVADMLVHVHAGT